MMLLMMSDNRDKNERNRKGPAAHCFMSLKWLVLFN